MKLKTILTILAATFTTNAFATLSCDDPTRDSGICYRMQSMRAHINQLDAQRELLQVNYPYLAAIAESLKSVATDLVGRVHMDNPSHLDGLKSVAMYANEVREKALQQDSNALVYANLVRSRCATCHTSTGAPPSGINWGDVFKQDWEMIAKNCTQFGKNPYLCKSMNGMLTAFSYFTTAANASIKNFEMTKFQADEIVRILQDLKRNKILHMPEVLRAEAEDAAKDISNLAAKKDPEVFDKSRMLPMACIKCHDQRPSPPRTFLDASAGLKTWEEYLPKN